MATSAKRLARQARQLSQRTQWISSRQTWHATAYRSFSQSTIHRADGDSTGSSESSSNAPYYNGKFFNKLDRNDQALYNTLSAEDRQKMETVKRQLDDEFAFDSARNKELERVIQQYTEDVDERYPEKPAERERISKGFFNMGEREDLGPDDEFQDDDITSDAHRELEQHREIREYARLAAWEMPLLASKWIVNQASKDFC